jgi:hypothetical protein
MVPAERIYRQVVDVLLAEHDARSVPDATEYPIKILGCAWGIYSYIHRLGRAATVLADNGMSFEVLPLARIMLEHAIVLHWVIERGDDGVDTMLANQATQMKNWMANTKNTELELPPALAAELTDSFAGIDESKALRAFKTMCEQLDAQSLYALYGSLSQFVHPTTTTSNMFVADSGLSATPVGKHSSNMALIAHCLIWAERAFDRLTPGEPTRAGLEKIAQSINARPILGAYHPVAPPKKKNNNRRGRGGRRR